LGATTEAARAGAAPRGLSIGPLQLASNLCLAPLAGWTTPAFRRVVRGIGGLGLATSEVVAAKALIGRNRNTEPFLVIHAEDRPLAAQVSAATAEEAAEAARILEARGFDAVDMNLGCPVRKIAGKGGGAGLARDCAASAAVVGAAVRAVAIPVTAKMRLGWGPGDLTAPALAQALAKEGVAAVAVHGRTRAQGFGGSVDLSGIKAVVDAVAGAIPVIGNGDVRDARGALRMLGETGADGVLIGRAAVTNPWIFAETRALLETGALPPPAPLEERLAACERHFALLALDVGELTAARRFRKVLRAWGVALGAGRAFWDEAARIEGARDLASLLGRVRSGEVATGGASDDGGVDPCAAPVVAVPAGPTDLW